MVADVAQYVLYKESGGAEASISKRNGTLKRISR